MILAGMIHEDKNSWICDMAEYYNIYDYTRVPVKTLGILSAGLREDSRIRQKLEGLKASPDTIIMAKIYDLVNLLLWSKTKDAEKGKNQPKSFAKLFLVSDEPEPASFSSGAEFKKARAELVKKIKGAG